MFLGHIGLALGITATTLIFASPSSRADGDVSVRPRAPQTNYRVGTNSQGQAIYEIRVCFNWTCDRIESFRLSQAQLRPLRAAFQCPASDPLTELKQVRLAVEIFEEIAEDHIPPLANDLGGNEDDRDHFGRTDCVDNATNTTNYLNFLQTHGFLKWFRVGRIPRMAVGFLGIRSHYTATLVLKNPYSIEVNWAVDSWTRPNGYPPLILPLATWKKNELADDPRVATEFNPRFCR